jgi:hypothetical protein
LAAVFAVFASLGATLLSASAKKSASLLHGISLLLVLLIGFMMLKKPPMGEYWWMIKFGLWLFIGVAPVLAKRKLLSPTVVMVLCVAAAAFAAYLGMSRPF